MGYGSTQKSSLCDFFFFNFLLSPDLVSLKSSLSPRDENPCFIYLKCGPNGGEEILSVGILSSARNMEVYLGEEYCGTSRGKNVCTVLDNRFVTCLGESVQMNQCLMFVDFLTLTGVVRGEKLKHASSQS